MHGMKKFLLRVAFFVLSVLIGFELLFRLGYSPVITNSTFFDHKMEQLRKHPVREVQLLAVGSSMTVYSLNSPIITENIHLPYYNFASWNLQITETRMLLDQLVKDYHPRYVLICSSPGDFSLATNDTYLTYTRTPRFIREHFPEWFYFANFTSIHQLFLRRQNTSYHLDIDQWGGGTGLLQLPPDFKGVEPDDILGKKLLDFSSPWFASQYRALDSLCAFLQEAKSTLIFAQVPVKPSIVQTDSLRQLIAGHLERCRTIVEGHGGTYLNYCDTAAFPDSLWRGMIHFSAEGSKVFTKRLVADLKNIIRQ